MKKMKDEYESMKEKELQQTEEIERLKKRLTYSKQNKENEETPISYYRSDTTEIPGVVLTPLQLNNPDSASTKLNYRHNSSGQIGMSTTNKGKLMFYINKNEI